ncbi:DUF2779 domain-containing protein [Arcobacter porcinus]|uniref:DUF2779 domain-containing protein n=1 Tax=Arcobacter porcinus TaxID=1935204 RepID=A0ABX2YB89_9BACT|nr:DUF2779 domain-containing protein [Arcobacter porcinus]OCL90836.1 hypothetical protein AAX28_01655 [Arcobacter porcinus]
MSNFTWVEIYKEIVEKIKDKNTEDLVNLLKDCENCQINYLKDKNGNFIALDLFTFFGTFNRDVKFENRIKVLIHLKDKLKLTSNLPSDFSGIPTMNNQNSWFYWGGNPENEKDITKLNELFIFAIPEDKNLNIEEKFNECLDISGVGLSKLTTGLFWINPEKFMPIAGPVISHLKRKFPNFGHENEKGAKAWDKIFKGMQWEQYEEVLNFLNDEENHLNVKKSFKELSLESIESSVENEILENKFDISRLKSQKKFELYQNGILEFSQITDLYSFSISQQIQIESERQNRTIINKEGIKEFDKSLSYPIYHLDFETFQQAIPEFKGVSPYSQIPFQYSLHIEHEDGRLEHKEFLAKDGVDPREEIAKRLVEDIPSNVTVLAYNMGFEKGVIRKLANLFEQYSHGLMAIHDNCKDLMIPFQNKDYYHPNMKGSYSIKYVLPSLVPEFENAYKELDLIHNGGEAMEAFANLSKIEDEKLKKILMLNF